MWWLLKRLESSVLNVMDGGPIVKMVWVVGPIFVQFTFCWRPLLAIFLLFRWFRTWPRDRRIRVVIRGVLHHVYVKR